MASVLIADDDQNLRDTLTEVLTEAGFDCVGVANGEEAVALLDQRQQEDDPFDIILLDMLLPKLSGKEVAQRLKGRQSKAALFMMSGVFKTSAHAQEAQEQFNPKAYLVKPFDNDELVQACMKVGGAPAKKQAAVPKNPLPAEGGLLEFPVIHLLWRAAREQHTGILDVFGVARRGRVFVYRGRAIMAQCSDPTIHIAAELIRDGVLSADLYRSALEMAVEARKGLYTVIKKEGWAGEKEFKAAYKRVIPRAIGHFIAASGRFRWTEGDAFSKLVPAAPLDLLQAVCDGLRDAQADQLAPHVEPRQTLRLAPGDNWDEVGGLLERAAGGSSLMRAINGRATIAQMLAAARNDEDRAIRMRQAYMLMSTQSVIASTEVIKIATPVSRPPPETPAPAQRPKPATSSPSIPKASAAKQIQQAEVKADDDIAFTPEEHAARRKITAALEEAKGKDYFEVLGVEPSSDPAEIKRAYFGLAREFHPDSFSGLRLGSAQDALDRVYALIQEAHTTLTDPKKRAEFEAGRQMEEEGVSTDIAALFEAERQFTKAKTLVDRGETRAAIRLLHHCHEVNPGNVEWKAYLTYAEWWQSREPSEAPQVIADLEESAKQLAALPEISYFAGHIALETGDLRRAKMNLKRSLDTNSNFVPAQRALRNMNKKAEDDAKKGGGLGRFLKR